MTSKRELKKNALRAALIDAARLRIQGFGLRKLRARDIANDANCALGSVYTAFEDINELVLHVNSITLSALGEALDTSSEEALTPGAKLEALARRYFRFAQQNKNLWQALFEHKMADGAPFPEWHLKEHSVLFQNITTPLLALCPDATDEDIDLQTKIIFSAVHGIISICLQERIIEAPIKQLERQLQQFVRTYVQGLK